MFTETRKIHLLEDLLKTTNEATLLEIETILGKSKKRNKPVKDKKPSIYDFVGILTKSDAQKMRGAIEETCERF